MPITASSHPVPGFKPGSATLGELQAPVRPVVFLDYDDTMAVTEKPAVRAAGILYNEIRDSFSLPAITPEEFHVLCVGRTFRQVLNDFLQDHDLIVGPNYVETMVAQEMQRAIATFKREGVEPTDGLEATLNFLARRKYPMAVVSSSHMARLKVCLKVTGQDRFFTEKSLPDGLVFSAQTSLPTPTPKPAPDIYFHARRVVEGLHKLDNSPTIGIAFEDSSSGVRSAKAAGMFTVGYVGVQPQERRVPTARALFEKGAHVVIEHWREAEQVITALERPDSSALPYESFGPEASKWRNS
jgi:beta-phosphoglucomutase-like phosphatase (HAD superfamily)